ncbi:hypothetical protein, partial [Variovorax sp. WDL1]|uniref:hypothetical protein n=1 Tax=Variovorax sp. WDL1 TaxID=207745 RepID=UPI000AB49ECE
MQASSATTNKPTKLIRTNSETLGLRPKNNPRSRPEQPFGKWDIGAPANLPTADVVVQVPRNLGNSSRETLINRPRRAR